MDYIVPKLPLADKKEQQFSAAYRLSHGVLSAPAVTDEQNAAPSILPCWMSKKSSNSYEAKSL